MHLNPAPRKRYKYVVPQHVKYIIVSAVVLFAAASAYIPAFSILYARSAYKNTITIQSDGYVTTITTTKKKLTKALPSPTPTAIPTLTPTNIPTLTKPAPTKTIEVTPVPTKAVETQSTSNVEPTNDTAKQLLSALNNYRQKNGKNPLSWDGKLGDFAKSRAEKFDHDGQMDEHAGFKDMIAGDGFHQMGFMSLAENSSFGDTRDAVYIIETLYGNSPGHNANQLNADYTSVGIGASGKATDFVFGGKKI